MTHDEREELSRIQNELARLQADLRAMVSVGDPVTAVPGETPPPPPAGRPLTEAQKKKLFGDPTGGKSFPGTRFQRDQAWYDESIASFETSRLDGVTTVLPPRIYLHENAIPPFVAMWNAWAAEGLDSLVLTWNGSLAWRKTRGGGSLSSHAFGIAFDINARWNGLGKQPAARGHRGSVVELLPIAIEHGWYPGFYFSRPDGMHFELAG